MAAATLAAPRRLPLAALDAVPALVAAYVTDFDAVARYYAGDPFDPAARAEAAARAAAFAPRARDAVADALRRQNERHGGLSGATAAHIEALRDPASVAVVTGQQVGLFGGPLYTVLKTITALQCAEAWAEELGRPVVPVFWVEGEDHDFAEIRAAHVLRRNAVVTLRYTGHAEPDDGNLGAVGRLTLTEQITRVLDQLDDALPPSDFKPDVMALARDAYAPGVTLEDAFTRLVRGLFPDAGLVFLNPDDPALKAVAAPLVRRELTDPAASAARVQAASAQLEADGFHAQVRARPTNLFLLTGGQRRRLDWSEDDGAFTVYGTGETKTQSELLALLETTPEAFSPNVVLRPLVQDLLVPTMAYVAGPGETSYFAQYGGVYEWAEVPRPLVYPRASATLVEGKVQKVLDKFDLTVDAFAEDADALFQRVVVEQMEVDVDAAFGEALPQVHRAVSALKQTAQAVDPTLGKAAEATRAALMGELNDLKSRIVRAEKRSQDALRQQLDKAYANVRPEGTWQERLVSVLYFLNKYSPALLTDLRAALSPDTRAHQVVEL